MVVKLGKIWYELRKLCVDCHAVAVFHNVQEGQKLYCDRGHYLGKAPKKEDVEKEVES